MTFTAVVIGHGNEHLTNMMLAQLRHQTRKPDEILLMLSNSDPHKLIMSGNARYHFCHDLGDWGHDKRRKGLKMASSEYVGFFNHDDVYSNEYIRCMMASAIGLNRDLIICDWIEGNHPMEARPEVGLITAGAFIVKAEVARRVGYNHNHYEADGAFIEDLVRSGATWGEWPSAELYTHL